MMNKMFKVKSLFISSVVALALAGCGEQSAQTSSSSSSQTEYSKPSVSDKKKEKDFRYTWLEGMDSNFTVEEGSMFDTNYYFVLDGSGSMSNASCSGNQPKIDVAKRAIADYVESLPDNVNIGLLAFDSEGITERYALGKGDKKGFKHALMLVKSDSRTPLESAIEESYGKIKEQANKQAARGEYNIIIVTDGEADIGEDPSDIVREIGVNSPVNIKTIGFCIKSNHSLNNKEFVYYYSAENYESILNGLSSVQAEGEKFTDAELIQNLDALADL